MAINVPNYRTSATQYFNSVTGENHKAWADAAAAYYSQLASKDKRNYVDAMNIYFAGLNDGSIQPPQPPLEPTQAVLSNGDQVTVLKASGGSYTAKYTATVANGVITGVTQPATQVTIGSGVTFEGVTGTGTTATITVAGNAITGIALS